MERDINLKTGYYWVNAFDAWIIAEFTDRFEWFVCGNEEDINDAIKEVGNYVGCDGENGASSVVGGIFFDGNVKQAYKDGHTDAHNGFVENFDIENYTFKSR